MKAPSSYKDVLMQRNTFIYKMVNDAVDQKLKRTDEEMMVLFEEFCRKKHTERVAAFVATTKQVNVKPEHVFYSDGEFPPKVQAALDEIGTVIGQDHLKSHLLQLCYQAIKQKHLAKLSPKVDYGICWKSRYWKNYDC